MPSFFRDEAGEERVSVLRVPTGVLRVRNRNCRILDFNNFDKNGDQNDLIITSSRSSHTPSDKPK